MISKKHFKITTLLLSVILVFSCQSNTQQKTSKDEGLLNQEISIVKIASHTSQGNLARLKSVLNEGLDNKLTVNETKEILGYTCKKAVITMESDTGTEDIIIVYFTDETCILRIQNTILAVTVRG